jgi:hypothetical protein
MTLGVHGAKNSRISNLEIMVKAELPQKYIMFKIEIFDLNKFVHLLYDARTYLKIILIRKVVVFIRKRAKY